MTLLFVVMVGGHALGAAATLLSRDPRVARGTAAAGAMIGGGAGLALALAVLLSGNPFTLAVPALLSVADGLAVRLDALGAFFLAVVGLLAVPCGLYGGAYCATYDVRYSQRLLGAMLNGFLLAMSLVPCASNVLTFLLMWEGMSLTSYFLVMTESDQRETVRAGGWYLAMTHAGLLCVMAAFLLLTAGASTTGFGDLRAAAGALSPAARNAVFALALIGFGSKAGIIPLHVWLPRAHPAAPSHVSALMSGVMIKLGVYGLLRFALDLLGGGPAWWGALVIGVGALSAVLGVLYALMEHDLKRLLAFHSVENIGIIFIAIGAGLMFRSFALPALAALGIVAGLYHTINHACFKGLLFLGAGSVVHATGTRNMEEMGGLIKRMPRTAFCFLLGACAISALPPLNGFVSEWLVFQTLLGGSAIPQPEVAVVMPIAVALLALSSGLAAACFVKAFGITFLAIPRSPRAERAHEASLSMQASLAALAVACVALGLLPFLVVPALGATLRGFVGLDPAAVAFGLRISAPVGEMSPTLLAVGLLVLVGLVPLGLALLGADRRVRVGDTWGCGRIGQTSRQEYTATAFAEPLRRVFAELYRPSHDLSIDFHPESKYFVQAIEYRSEIHPWFERALYAPLVSALRAAGGRIRRLQAGSVHLYLVYMLAALLILLVVARCSQ
jgi:hydrogenase-4 component B